MQKNHSSSLLLIFLNALKGEVEYSAKAADFWGWGTGV
jgi:hypothetical protein